MLKKLLPIILIMLFATTLVSCNKEKKYSYGDDEVMLNLWKDKTIYNETVVLEDNGSEISGKLLFSPTKIISVRDYTLQKEYDESNYTIEGNKIIRTENSKMPFLTSEQLAGNNLPAEYSLSTYDAKEPGTKIVFTEGIGIVMHQLAVTYEHNETFGISKIENMGKLFPNLHKKLEEKEKINIVLNGDSISTGANSSGVLGIEPYLDNFGELFSNQLKRKYKSEISLINTSLGGTISKWGKENVDPNINAYNPDLVIIGFGMNDGSMNVPSYTYLENIEFMIRSIKANNPNAEIIIISTILANPLSIQNQIQETYLNGLLELTNKHKVGLLDMTTLSKEIYKIKKGVDILANNINHPSDFLVRLYASGLYQVIGGK